MSRTEIYQAEFECIGRKEAEAFRSAWDNLVVWKSGAGFYIELQG